MNTGLPLYRRQPKFKCTHRYTFDLSLKFEGNELVRKESYENKFNPKTSFLNIAIVQTYRSLNVTLSGSERDAQGLFRYTLSALLVHGSTISTWAPVLEPELESRYEVYNLGVEIENYASVTRQYFNRRRWVFYG